MTGVRRAAPARWSRAARRVVVALLAGSLTAGPVAAGPAAAAPRQAQPATAAAYPVPDSDPFYASPPGIGSYPNGAVVRWRPISAKVRSWASTVPLRAWQVAYKTLDAHDAAITNVTTVLLPDAPYRGRAASRPLISYQAAEDSTGTQCAPSYALRTDNGLMTASEQTLMALALQRGYALVVPDHEGPNSAFLAGPQSAHVILDGIRAALRFTPAGFTARTPVGEWGYSGGGAATAWAAEQQRAYAPELTVAGIAFGGAPTDLASTIRTMNGGPFAAFIWDGLVGLHNAYPEWDITGQLNAGGRASFATATRRCIADVGVELAFTRIENSTTLPNPLSQPQNVAIIATIDLGQRVPVAPVFDYWSYLDEAVPARDSQALVATYCRGGGRVVSRGVPLSDHVTLPAIMTPPLLDFLGARFDGVPLTSPCR